MVTETTTATARAVLVEPQSRMRPVTVYRLNEWQYLERTIQRLLAGWGRSVEEFYDKSAIHKFVWEQAECARRLRERVDQFPGENRDLPVAAQLEELGNTVLLAPTCEDALDGIFSLLTGALIVSYITYTRSAHGVHDAPTIAMLHEIIGIKEQQRLWYRDYRRRRPHVTDRAYADAVGRALAACGQLAETLPVTTPAGPVGVNTSYRLPRVSARPARYNHTHGVWEWTAAEFTTNLEMRRLFWCYGYLMEKNIPDDQLRWLWSAHGLPWEFQYDVSRHLWDESRHGDSGASRLADFGIPLEEIGFPAYAAQAPGFLEALTPAELYELVFSIGMIAETGHFPVKQEAYQDFRDGGDLESAEMMLFDIIDENAHVQYCHKWLPVLAQYAGLDNSNYKARAATLRAECQAKSIQNAIARANQPRDANYAFVQDLLARMRRIKPLTNAATCPPRSPLPM